jgi:hypothetical protein
VDGCSVIVAPKRKGPGKSAVLIDVCLSIIGAYRNKVDLMSEKSLPMTSIMNSQILVILLVVIVLLNLGGGHLISGYGTGPLYGYSWPGILGLFLILFLLFG